MTTETHKMDHTAACWGIAGVLAVIVFGMSLGMAEFSVIVSLAWSGVMFLSAGLYLMWMLCPEELGFGAAELSHVSQSVVLGSEMSPVSPVGSTFREGAEQGTGAEG